MYNKSEKERVKEKRMVICSNCGGRFEQEYSYCPYCGYMNEPSAKKQLEDKMKNISTDLEELPEETKEIYETTVKKEVNKTLRIFILLFLVVFSLVLISGIFTFLISRSTTSVEEELQWEKEYFPVLDGLYEKKDYDGILQFLEEHYEDPGECFYLWKHYDFLNLYERYKECKLQKQKMEKNAESGGYPMSILIFDACQLAFYPEIYLYEQWEKEQEEQLLVWQKEMTLFLKNNLGLKEEEISQLEANILENGYLTYSLCEKIEKEIEKRQ